MNQLIGIVYPTIYYLDVVFIREAVPVVFIFLGHEIIEQKKRNIIDFK